jgi:hypothetical protein
LATFPTFLATFTTFLATFATFTSFSLTFFCGELRIVWQPRISVYEFKIVAFKSSCLFQKDLALDCGRNGISWSMIDLDRRRWLSNTACGKLYK